jgi:hypothetical protein
MSHRELTDYAREFAQAHGIRNYDLFGTKHLRTRWHRRLLFRQEQAILAPLEPVAPTNKIVFHFRSINKQGPDTSRNFRPELAEQTAAPCIRNGFEVACIGHPSYALCPAGCEDCRSEHIEKAIATISSSRLVVGELSGPLHLAAYCAKPIVIWAPGQFRIDCPFRRNPFNVRIFVVRNDTSNPTPEEVLSTIKTAAEELNIPHSLEESLPQPTAANTPRI